MPFVFDRVLGGEHQERLGQAQGLAFERHLSLLHGFEQGGLGLGRGAVDLIREQNVGEDRTLAQFEFIFRAVENVTAGDVAGQEIGRELDALEVQPEHGGETARDERLAQAGEILEQDVSARQRGRHHHFEQGALAHHGALDFGDHFFA